MRPTVAAVLVVCVSSSALAGEWKQLPSLPDKEGFAGSFAGVSNGTLLVAGGANFPEKKPWDGGQKVWYDSVFVLEQPIGEWKLAGKLPRPLGYGVSVTHGTGVVCVGGSDSARNYADAFRLEWKGGKLITTKLPSLPNQVANACGALVGDTLFIAGGQEKPDSTDLLKTVYQMDLSAVDPKWSKVDSYPGAGRMLSVAAGCDGAFWLISGVELVVGKDQKPERRYLTDAYCYRPAKGWKRIEDVPTPVAAAPSPAKADNKGFMIFGGDDGSQVGVAPDKHRGFRKNATRYDLKTSKWVEDRELPASRVTAACVLWNNSWVVPSGEVRPGVRSPEVWQFTPGNKE